VFDLDPDAPNVLPSRYRQVSVTDVADLDPATLVAHFADREAYVRTRFVVARCGPVAALVEVARSESADLFSRTVAARVLATAEESCYVVDPEVDVGVPSQLASVAAQRPGMRCVVVEGRYSHVSFLLNPAPLRLQVLDIVPPWPSKLFDQVRRVLDVADDLPPVVPLLAEVDSRAVLADAGAQPAHVLAPCRGAGLELAGASVTYLDQRPPRQDWTLLGCERSLQIHRWFYGDTPPIVDVCPRRFLEAAVGDGESGATLSRCCLLQEGLEEGQSAVLVPWGSSLQEVRRAIEVTVAGVVWTRT
jgi:hypothetical protein